MDDMLKSGLVAAVASAVLLVAAVSAHADDAAQMRQYLETLKGRIEQIDTALAEVAQRTTSLNDAAETYRRELKESSTTGAKLAEARQKMTVHKERLDAENAAATKTCHRTTTQREYAAVVAQCKKAAEAYQQHADAFRQDYEKLAAEIAAYDAKRRLLTTQRDDLEKNQQENRARLASLQGERADLAARYNEIRDQLMTAAPKAN